MSKLISRYEALSLFKNNDLISIVVDNDKYNHTSACYWRIDNTANIMDSENMKHRIERMTSFLYNKENRCLHCC